MSNASAEGTVCNGWDNSGCEGTPHCPPRCPRFWDREGTAGLVRPYRPDDREALVEMYRGLDPSNRTMGLPPVTEDRLRDWLDRFIEDGWSLVVEIDSEIVGHTGVSPLRAAEPHFVVFVADGWQGRGVGSELLRQLVAYAADSRYEALVLTVAADNRRAIDVYERVGFERVRRLSSEFEMRLSLQRPIAETVQRFPAERE